MGDDTPMAIARALWLRECRPASPLDWPEFFAWYEREAAKDEPSAADNSAIGHCVRRAEKVLRLIEAAGLKVEEAYTQKGAPQPKPRGA